MLEFWHYYDAESTYDGATYQFSGWSKPNLLNPENGYPQSSVSALTGPGYSGQSAGWIYARFPCQLCNQSVSFRFKFASDIYEMVKAVYRRCSYYRHIPYAGRLAEIY
jgi:hypothetical protein